MAKYRNAHIEEGQFPELSSNDSEDIDDFDDEYSRMAAHVKELQGLSEAEFDEI
jgi:DNA-directed RNA polymerase subunit beta'